MMLVPLFLLLGSSPRPERVYPLHGVAEFFSSDAPSCDASLRMLRDRYVIRQYRDGTITVNGKLWENVNGGSVPGYVELQLHTTPHNYTWMDLRLQSDDDQADGDMTLHGRLPDRRPCVDEVTYSGDRL